MYDCDFVPALTEIINSKPPINMVDDILQTLESEIYIFDSSQLDLDAIAPRLHQIYVSSNPDVRTAVLYFCRKLDEITQEKVTEKYMFDYLVSQSLGRKIPIDLDNSTDYQLSISNGLSSSDHLKLNRQNSQVTSLQSFHKIHHIFNCYNNLSIPNNPSSVIDKEKLACFKYIEMLILKKNGYLPSSIVRALVSLYESKYRWHNECKATVLDLLAQASVNFTSDQKYLMPSVISVFSSYLFEDPTNMTIPALFAYSIENNLPIIYDDLVLMNFFIPLSNYSLFVNNINSVEKNDLSVNQKTDVQHNNFDSNFEEKIENAQQALTFFLRTWPGMLYFGIKNKAIENLLICMPYKPKVVIGILKSLLNLKGNTSSVTDGYSGFLLAELLKLGFIEKLNQECSSISQNQVTYTDPIMKSIESTYRSSFSLFSNKISSTQTNAATPKENSEIIEECENFINELLPFTSHCSTGDSIQQPQRKPINKPLKDNRRQTNSLQRSSYLNSDSDLEFYNMSNLLNLTGDEYSSSISSTAPINNSASCKLNTDDTFSRMIDVAQVITHKSNLISVNDVLGKKKEFNYCAVNWTEIQILLTVVLPYDHTEAKASSKLYTSMLNFLSSQEFANSSTAKRYEMFEPYCSLFDLLLNGKLEENFIEENVKFKELIKNTIKEIKYAKSIANLIGRNKSNSLNLNNNNERSESTNKKSPKNSPLVMNIFSSTSSLSPTINDEGCFDLNSSKWFIFKLLMKIISNKKGVAIIKKWKLTNKIVKMGKKIANCQIAAEILSEILFTPDSSLTTPTFLNFLSSSDNNIHKSALSQLRILRRKLPNFHQICFKPILIEHIKEIKSKAKSLFSSLNFLGEVISTDETSLITVCEDIDLIRIIFNNSHPIFSLLLSREETKKTWDSSKYSGIIKEVEAEKNIPLDDISKYDSSTDSNLSSSSFIQSKSDRHGRRISKENLLASFSNIKFDEIVDREIRYWMDFGNLSYYKSFNSAVDAMFSDTLENAIKKQPAIFVINGCAQPPPHLFGQLSKLEDGLKKLTPHIQELVNTLVSLIDNPNYCMDKNYSFKEEFNNNESNDDSLNNSNVSFQLRKGSFKDVQFASAPNSPPLSVHHKQRRNSTPRSLRIKQGTHAVSRHAADENICGILFALAQLGSVPSSNQIVEDLGIVEKMIQASVASPSYVIKGALISALSLFAPSDYLSSVLQRYKWQKFRFGNRSCIIPRKPRSLFRETAVKKLNIVTAAAGESTESSFEYSVPSTPKASTLALPPKPRKIPSLSMQNDHLKQQSKALKHPSASFDSSILSTLRIQDDGIEEDSANILLSIVFDQKCIKKLSNDSSSGQNSNVGNVELEAATNDLINKIGKDKINAKLKIWINKIMSSYEIENDARDLINYLFQDIPLVDLPDNCENKIDDRVLLTAKFNQICISSKGLYKDKPFREIKPFIATINEIKKLKPPFPEASLKEEELKEIASVSRSDFYELDDEKKEQIRNMLRGD